MRDDVEILLAAQKIRQLFVDVAAAVEARVDDDRVLADVQSERLIEDDAHARIVIRADVHVADLAAG